MLAADMTVRMISATVEIDQPQADGHRIAAAGFLVSDPTPDGRPRTVLVTANHVFDDMPGDTAMVGYRTQGADGAWAFTPQPLPIRAGGKPLWNQEPGHDIAVLAVQAPPAFAQAAVPLSWLAGDADAAAAPLTVGQEMLALGYPDGLAANAAGFPILRQGRIASWPLGGSATTPTFLLDLRAYPGNSGGPVWTANGPPQIDGVLTQQVESGGHFLGLAVVARAQFVLDALARLDAPPPAAPLPGAVLAAPKD